MKIIAQHTSNHSPMEDLLSRVLEMDETDIDLFPPIRVAVGVREYFLVPPPMPGRKADRDRRRLQHHRCHIIVQFQEIDGSNREKGRFRAACLDMGKLAISQLIDVDKLKNVVGVKHRVTFHGRETDVIPLPHPSGASTWHRMEPGKSLLANALRLIHRHSAWKKLIVDR